MNKNQLIAGLVSVVTQIGADIKALRRDWATKAYVDDALAAAGGGGSGRDPSWPIVIASRAGGGQGVSNAFTKIVMGTTDYNNSGSAWSLASSQFTVPAGQAGLYMIGGLLRYDDVAGGSTLASYGLGFGGALVDNPFFRWTESNAGTNPARQGLERNRVVFLNEGDVIFMYSYVAGTTLAVSGAAMHIVRIG